MQWDKGFKEPPPDGTPERLQYDEYRKVQVKTVESAEQELGLLLKDMRIIESAMASSLTDEQLDSKLDEIVLQQLELQRRLIQFKLEYDRFMLDKLK